MDREPAPAGADLEHVVVRAELEPVADPLELRKLRVLQARPGFGKVGAGVDQPPIEERFEELVAEVVVRGDVRRRARPGVAGDEVDRSLKRAHERMDPPAPAIPGGQVPAGDPDHGDEVVRGPEPLDITLAEPGAAAQRPAVGPRVADLDPGVELGDGRAKGKPLPALLDLEATAAHPRERGEERAPGERPPHVQPQSSIDFGSSGSTLTTISPPIFCL